MSPSPDCVLFPPLHFVTGDWRVCFYHQNLLTPVEKEGGREGGRREGGREREKEGEREQ